MAEKETVNIPASLDEAITQLENMLLVVDKDALYKNDASSFHFGIGMGIRNKWGLWTKTSPLALWFNQHGVYHADDMSGILMEALRCKIRGEPYDMAVDIARFNEHWKKCGVDPQKENV